MVLFGNWPVMRVYSSGFLDMVGKQQLFGRSGFEPFLLTKLSVASNKSGLA